MTPTSPENPLIASLSALAATTGASTILFGEFLLQPLPRVRTLCCIRRGETQENFSYRSEGDPAADIAAVGRLFVPSGIRQRYPQSLLLRDFRAEAYAARRVDFDNQSAGIIALLWENPCPQGDPLEYLDGFASQFTVSAGALQREMERERTRYRSFVHNEFFREYALDSPDAISFSEFMPPVPLDLPEAEVVERAMHTGYVVEGNRAMASSWGLESVEKFLGATPYFLNGPEKAPRVVRAWMQNGFVVRDAENQGIDAAGEIVWTRGSAVGNISRGKLTHFWTKRRDITAQKRYEAAIEHKAHHDALTGLPNRHWFQQHIEDLISQHRASGKQFCLGLLDLNGFKEINDTLGHAVGDRILEAVSKRLLKGLKPYYAALARLGGDEFAIVLPEVEGVERCEAMAMTVQELLNEPFPVEDMQLSIGGAIGFALFPSHSDCGDDLLRMADVAMYSAKREGAPHFWYRPELDQHSRRRLSLLSSLGPAIEAGELLLMYQPVIDLHTDALSGFEALVRWRHPQLGLIPPADFIPFAETSEVIRPLTRWVLAEAIRQGAAWMVDGHVVQMSVNVSVRNLLDDRLAPHIADCLAQHDLPPHLLKLEVTESALMTRPAQAMHTLQQLRALGVTTAIDDFGTGYSSLDYLARLPVNTLKVDQSFVREMLKSKTDEQIVRAIVGLAHQCQLSVVAEGVEEGEALAVLRGMGCDQAQGYLIARPMEAAAVEEWMRGSPFAGVANRPPAAALHLEQL